MVFPQDPKWQRDYLAATGGSRNDRSALSNSRFRSWGTEELLVRCIGKNLPWLRTIYILLARESQAEYLSNLNNKSTPSIRFVFHDDFIPAQYLPTFNANTIEMWLHKIPGLSECFIYGNDDVFPLSPLQPEDFFRNGLPCQRMKEEPYPEDPNIFHKFVKNGLDMVAADWCVKFTDTWLRTGHSLQPMLRSTVEHVCAIHADRILQSFTLRRDTKNFNQYIFPFWQHLSGRYIDHVPQRRKINKNVPTEEMASIIQDKKNGVVCIIDNRDMADWEVRAEIVRREIAARLSSDKV